MRAILKLSILSFLPTIRPGSVLWTACQFAFFEAHEHWESVWLAAQEPEKTFLQGLIQVAAAFHHFQRGNCVGTISLLRSGLRRLDGFQETFGGIGVAPLRTSIRLWLEALETVPQSPPPPHPQLQLA